MKFTDTYNNSFIKRHEHTSPALDFHPFKALEAFICSVRHKFIILFTAVITILPGIHTNSSLNRLYCSFLLLLGVTRKSVYSKNPSFVYSCALQAPDIYKTIKHDLTQSIKATPRFHLNPVKLKMSMTIKGDNSNLSFFTRKRFFEFFNISNIIDFHKGLLNKEDASLIKQFINNNDSCARAVQDVENLLSKYNGNKDLVLERLNLLPEQLNNSSDFNDPITQFHDLFSLEMLIDYLDGTLPRSLHYKIRLFTQKNRRCADILDGLRFVHAQQGSKKNTMNFLAHSAPHPNKGNRQSFFFDGNMLFSLGQIANLSKQQPN